MSRFNTQQGRMVLLTRLWTIVATIGLGSLATSTWEPLDVSPAHAADRAVHHVVGTVSTIDQKRLVVTTFKGQTISIKLTNRVRYKDKTNPHSNRPPAVGDRVIVEAVRDNKTLTATVIHYSPMNQPLLQPE